MSSYRFQNILPVILLVLTVGTVTVFGQNGALNGQWRATSADGGSTRYSPLDQINRDNVGELEIAWIWKSDNYGSRPEYKAETTPIMVNGVLYFTVADRRVVVAADAGTGETLWIWRMDEGERFDKAPRKISRGVSYWTDGTEERIFTITPGFHLVALNAGNGQPVEGFGEDGVVDLFEELGFDFDPIGTIGNSSPPVVSHNVVVVGPALDPGGRPPSKGNTKADVMAFDARTGKKIWVFHTVPRPGEFGYDTWLDGSAEYTGNAGIWPPFTVDEELGYVYLPVEDATSDYYGGHRPGNNLFSASVVCLDIRTGERI
ncbi:MAG: PQQ-binding-like beta-propeller repeat protein, partial [Pirellulaceae bacterium]|nr:PQQ-binding-like beta-propeller repeat protein [Pirellulaceae bacterium]